jgi:hypothetical protein
VYFWRAQKAPQPLRGRRARMFARWHGPTVVLGRQIGRRYLDPETSKSYWVVHKGTLLLVAEEHLRSATREEMLADRVMSSVLEEAREALQQDRQQLRFRDLRGQDGPREQAVPVAEVAQAMRPGNEPEPPQRGGARQRGGAQPEPEAELPGSQTVPATPAHSTHEHGRDDDVTFDSTPTVDGQLVPIPDEPDDELMETLILRNKAFKKGRKGSELDPRAFDGPEWELFRDADDKQWQAHLKSGAVRIVSPEEVGHIDPTRISPIPARFARTNKGEDGGTVQAKSRLVVPGHLAPKEDIRTDAPVAPQVALRTLFSLAAVWSWPLGTFDVADAFLSGKENERKLYVRPPKEGVRGVPQGALIELVKGVFGLKESPRLWWLKLRDAILEAGFQECRTAPGTFMTREKDRLTGMLCVHVDDGVWAGEGKGFRKAQETLRRLMRFKVEKTGEFDLLGRHVAQTKEGIRVDQWSYLKSLKPVLVSKERRRNREALLTPHEKTQFLSLTQQLAWPARVTLPDLNYFVSDLQQRTASATVADLVKANWVLRHAQELGRKQRRLWFKAHGFDTAKATVLVAHDASFAEQPGGASQQGHVIFVAQSESLTCAKETSMHVVEWSSGKIHRVARSTLAAEAASASHAHDRGTVARVLLAELLFAQTELHWTQAQRAVKYGLVSDCSSLVDHCQKTGSSVSEKRVGLDIADVRAAVDAG